MSMLRVMPPSGDDRVTWDARQIETGDPEALAAVREAERNFRERREAGATAFRIESGRTLVRIVSFAPAAEQIVMIPRLVGG